MPPEIRTETRLGPARMMLAGQAMIEEREVTIITDLRVTPWGTYDFGSIQYGPRRWVKADD